ncbi:MAG: site-specific integrase [Planctomycetaceae bacterium]
MAEPWTLTREMFLDERETAALLRALDERVAHAGEDARAAAITDRLIVQALLFSGLRNSEFCRLRLRDTIVGTKKSAFEVRGTPRQDRTVFVPDSVSRLVREYCDEVRRDALPEGVAPKDLDQPLVLNERGNPYERTALYRRVVRILTDAGFGSKASVQLLRHTYGFLGYKRTGGNLLFLQRQLGHAHPMVTIIYAEFVDESYPELANRIGDGAATAGAPSKRRSASRANRSGASSSNQRSSNQ